MLGIIQDASGMLKAPNGSLLTTLKNGGNAEHGLGHDHVPAWDTAISAIFSPSGHGPRHGRVCGRVQHPES